MMGYGNKRSDSTVSQTTRQKTAETAMHEKKIEKEKLNQETARIAWADLQKHFARGVVYQVDPSLDLIEVGYQMSVDNREQVGQWLDQELLGKVTDRQAGHWYETSAVLWATVVQPWVLVQAARGC